MSTAIDTPDQGTALEIGRSERSVCLPSRHQLYRIKVLSDSVGLKIDLTSIKSEVSAARLLFHLETLARRMR